MWFGYPEISKMIFIYRPTLSLLQVTSTWPTAKGTLYNQCLKHGWSYFLIKHYSCEEPLISKKYKSWKGCFKYFIYMSPTYPNILPGMTFWAIVWRSFILQQFQSRFPAYHLIFSGYIPDMLFAWEVQQSGNYHVILLLFISIGYNLNAVYF